MLKNLDDGFKYVYTGKMKQVIVGNTKVVVHEIAANKSFDTAGGWVEKGQLGGFVKIGVLAHDGNCWVDAGSVVAGDCVRGNALIINSNVLKGEVSGDAVVTNSTIEGGIVQGIVTESVIDGKVRDNATIISSQIIDGAKIGKNEDNNNDSVTISGSLIKGKRTYVLSGIIKGSTVSTNYKLKGVYIADSKIIDENNTIEEVTDLYISKVEFVSSNSSQNN